MNAGENGYAAFLDRFEFVDFLDADDFLAVAAGFFFPATLPGEAFLAAVFLATAFLLVAFFVAGFLVATLLVTVLPGVFLVRGFVALVAAREVVFLVLDLRVGAIGSPLLRSRNSPVYGLTGAIPKPDWLVQLTCHDATSTATWAGQARLIVRRKSDLRRTGPGSLKR